MRRQDALAKAFLVGAVAALLGGASLAYAQGSDLKHYDSNNKAFWTNPPADWFLGDETKEQKGLVPNAGQPTPTPLADLEKNRQVVFR